MPYSTLPKSATNYTSIYMFFSTDAHRASKYAILAHFYNHLTISWLPRKGIIQHTSTHNKHYERCLFALRNMPSGCAKNAKRCLG